MKKIQCFVISFLLYQLTYAQSTYIDQNINTITTAVPFLLINPNAQSMGIADIGVVAAKEYYESGLTQNPALLARNEKVLGFKISTKPWLLHLAPDIRMRDASIYYAINKKITVAYSYNRFSLGTMDHVDNSGQFIMTTQPVESYHNIRYAQLLSPNLSMGVGLKYVVSDLTNDSPVNGMATQKGRALAGDIGIDYRKEFAKKEMSFWRYDIGASILNIGNKVNYSKDTVDADFLPMQLAIGTMWTFTKDINEKIRYSIDLAYQAEKLLVPTPPLYLRDASGQIIYGPDKQPIIEKGKNPDVSVMQGAFQSFNDAPDGGSEELQELIHKFGVENRFTFNNKWTATIRTGLFTESERKGNRRYLNLGTGIRYKFIYLDFAVIARYRDGEDATGKTIYRSGLRFPYYYSYCLNLGFKYTFKDKVEASDEEE